LAQGDAYVCQNLRILRW